MPLGLILHGVAGVCAQEPIRTGDITVRGLNAADFLRVTKLANNVYAYEQIDPSKRTVTVNNLIVITTEGVLVAEGQGTVDHVKRLVGDIAALTPQPIKYIVVGSEHGDHTGGDLAVYLPRDKILFMSEVFSNRIFPSKANGYPTEWVETLRKAEQLDASVYVPAHGFIDSAAVLHEEERNYRLALERIIAEGTRLHNAKVPIENAPAANNARSPRSGACTWSSTVR